MVKNSWQIKNLKKNYFEIIVLIYLCKQNYNVFHFSQTTMMKLRETVVEPFFKAILKIGTSAMNKTKYSVTGFELLQKMS